MGQNINNGVMNESRVVGGVGSEGEQSVEIQRGVEFDKVVSSEKQSDAWLLEMLWQKLCWNNGLDMGVISCLTPDPLKQEHLLIENVHDPLAGEQKWPTEEEMAEAERNHKEKKLKNKMLPRGTSDYQAAWIVDDSDVDNSESEENEDGDDGMVLDNGEDVIPRQGHGDCFALDEDQGSLSLHSDEETDTDSVMMESEKLTKEQIEDEIKKIKESHAEDEGS
nr:pre-rRNA-processing protein TSR1 homolog [Ipomoea trifida]